MANLAVFASGTGSNFVALADDLAESSHNLVLLVTDNPDAPAVERAGERRIPVFYARYKGREREAAERDILAELERRNCDLVALAGFMRILTPTLIDGFPGAIVNIHPSLLPRHPGTRAIEKSYHSGDTELGITIHFVDYGVDTGPIVLQQSFKRSEMADLEAATERIHALEHRWYPTVVRDLLDRISQGQIIQGATP